MGAWRSSIWLCDVEGREAETGARKVRFRRALTLERKTRKPELSKSQSKTVQREERCLQAGVDNLSPQVQLWNADALEGRAAGSECHFQI